MKKSHGQALFEIVAMLAVVSLVILGLTTGLNLSLKNIQYVKEKSIAENYAREVIEWLIFQRDLSWTNIANHIGAYCFDQLEWDNLNLCDEQETGDYLPGTNFRRQIVITDLSPGGEVVEVQVLVEVRWSSPGGGEVFSLSHHLTKWK